MNSRKLLAGILCLGFLAYASPASAQLFQYAPKLNLRVSNGYLSNNTGGRGNARTFGGLNLGALYYATPRLAFGIGYQYHWDLSSMAVLLQGFDISGRWYFYGEGTRVINDDPLIHSESRKPLGAYLGTDLSKRTFFIGSNPEATTDTPLSGDSMNINAVLGIDVHLAEHFDLNVEGSYGVLSFAQTDDRFRISAILLHIGISYVW